MPYTETDDGVSLYYEECGHGEPIIFVHEFAGDHRSWEPQLRYFSQHFRVIAYNARGYPPSQVPEAVSSYSQDRAADDIAAVLNHLGIAQAHVVGLSMGAFAALHFGFRYPRGAQSLVVAGCGYGAELSQRERFRAEADLSAAAIMEKGMSAFAEKFAHGPSRVQYQNKDGRGFALFKDMLASHSAVGSANTMLGCQKERPSLYDLTRQMQALAAPTLILCGDEDWPCLAPAILLKEHISAAGLAVVPNCGHCINLEAPVEFNRLVEDFIAQVEIGKWPRRDPRAMSASLTGMKMGTC